MSQRQVGPGKDFLCVSQIVADHFGSRYVAFKLKIIDVYMAPFIGGFIDDADPSGPTGNRMQVPRDPFHRLDVLSCFVKGPCLLGQRVVHDQKFDARLRVVAPANQEAERSGRERERRRSQSALGLVPLNVARVLSAAALESLECSDPVGPLMVGRLGPAAGHGIVVKRRLVVEGVPGFLPAPRIRGLEIHSIFAPSR